MVRAAVRQEADYLRAISQRTHRVSVRPAGERTLRDHAPVRGADGAAATAGRRAAILGASLELFAVQGFRATTMADLGEAVGIRGPSIYKYFSSKQQILSDILFSTMDQLIANYAAAVASTDDIAEQVQRAAEAHVRYHARHRFEAFVGTREINSLDEPGRSALIDRRNVYERGFRQLIEKGRRAGRFDVGSARLASYAILDMGMGVAVWFREDGPISEDEVVYRYGSIALRIVGSRE